MHFCTRTFEYIIRTVRLMVVTVSNKRHFTNQNVFSVVKNQIIHVSVTDVHLRGHNVLLIEQRESMDGRSTKTQILK